MRKSSILRSATASVKEEKEQTKQLVSFRIGSEEFGVDILKVQEIIRLPNVTPIPNAPRFIQGVINLRGKIIPVIDLRKRLKIQGQKEETDSRKARILIVELDAYVTGFIVDSVSEVMKISTGNIEPTPHLVASSIGAEYIKGVVKLPNRLIILLDFRAVLNAREEKELEKVRTGSLKEGERSESPKFTESG